MDDKPGTKDLERRIQELELIAAEVDQVKKALEESEARYHLLAENVNDAISVMDENLNLTYISPSNEKLTGFTAEESLKQKVEEQITADSIERLNKAIAENFGSFFEFPDQPARSLRIELEAFRKDGSTGWSEVNMTFLRSPEGNFNGIVSVSRDISVRKRTEDELQHYRDQLEELVAERSARMEEAREAERKKELKKSLRRSAGSMRPSGCVRKRKRRQG